MSLPTPFYEQDGITLYHGDAADIVHALPEADLVLTDPPYGIGMDKGLSSGGGRAFGGHTWVERRTYEDDWDQDRPHPDLLRLIIQKAPKTLIFGGNYFADILPRSTHWLVWDKLNRLPSMSDCELIWSNISRKSVKKFTHEYNGCIGGEPERYHPTQKPLALIVQLLERYSEAGETVLDPFAGSATTLVAAKRLQRRAIGIEKEEKYCDVAACRLAQGVLPL